VGNFSKNAVEESIVPIMKMKKTSIAGIFLAHALAIGTAIAFAADAADKAPVGASESNAPLSGAASPPTKKPMSKRHAIWAAALNS
jgi:hypothetical protein